MIVENVQILNTRGKNLAGRIYLPEKRNGAGVVFSHGLFSTKDGYKITRLSRDIVSSGLALLTFDFSFSGESGSSISDISLGQEVRDLSCAVDFFKKCGIRTLHLMGSSMGALVSLVYASMQHTAVASLVLIAAPVDIRRVFMPDKVGAGIEAYPENETTIIDGVPVKNSFFRELIETDMVEALKKIEAPVLAIHGGRDAVVDIENLSMLESCLPARLKKIIIEDGDHNLTRDSDLEVIRSAIVSWLKKF